MLITKLELIGHVHNAEDRVITEVHSFPDGKTEDEVDFIIDKFAKAFTLVSIKTIPDGYVYISGSAKTQLAGTPFFETALIAQ